jgi:hypothetical protein
MLHRAVSAKLMLAILLTVFAGACALAQGNLSVYSDELDNGFQDWGWATHNYANPSPVHSGTYSISVTIDTNNYPGLQICRAVGTDLNSTPYNSLSLWINGGSGGGQQLQVYGLLDAGGAQSARQLTVTLPDLQTNWQQVTIPLSSLGVADSPNFTGFVIQSSIGATQATFYVDDIQLDANPPPALVHIGVDAAQTIRAADARWFGLNTALWDGYFDTPTTANDLKQLGTRILRFPGGSDSDAFHWQSNYVVAASWEGWPTWFTNFAHIATNVGAQAVITANYGTGTPAEAAAWVRCSNVTNHYAFANWEIGNECYGTWEMDSNSLPHDPYTYAVRAAQYFTQMTAVDSTIKIGVPVVPGEDNNDNGYTSHPIYNPRTHTTHYGWTPVVLATLKSLGVTPDFLVHHVYPEYNVDNDQDLLQASTNWAADAADLRQQISDYFGTGGTNIQLYCTENNSDAGNQGRQSTSIVNALYLADSLAELMKTEFNSYVWWDLRNGSDTSGDFDSSLYGWRSNGDIGMIGGLDTRYPDFYGFKLMQYFANVGDTVLQGTSDSLLLSSYAARKADGALALLVINKYVATNLNAQIALMNFSPWSTATVRSFGIAQDEATRTNSSVPGAQDIATNSFAVAGTNFTATFPPYSLTLFTFAPAAPTLVNLGRSGSNYVFQLQGQSGVPYQIQTSTNLAFWTSNSTVTLPNTTWILTNTIAAGPTFWRAVWFP